REASVVLPQPDSPTSPTVWPRGTSRSTPSTALTDPPPWPRKLRRTGKCFVTPRRARAGSSLIGLHRRSDGTPPYDQDRCSRVGVALCYTRRARRNSGDGTGIPTADR